MPCRSTKSRATWRLAWARLRSIPAVLTPGRDVQEASDEPEASPGAPADNRDAVGDAAAEAQAPVVEAGPPVVETGSPVVVGPGAAFPLKVASGNRYLIDQSNVPFFINGEAAWSLIVATTDADAEKYLEDRRQKGFNAI